MSHATILYVPVSHSIAPAPGARPARYFGTVYRIPKSDYGTIRQLEWEPTPAELLADAPAAVPGPQRDPGAAIERLEVCDPQSGDILVMYRVPYTL